MADFRPGRCGLAGCGCADFGAEETEIVKKEPPGLAGGFLFGVTDLLFLFNYDEYNNAGRDNGRNKDDPKGESILFSPILILNR
jgi:hypothetical protein